MTPTRRPRPVKLVQTQDEPLTEQEWATYYQAHKDDPDVWGDPEPFPLRQKHSDVTAEPEPHVVSAFIAARFRGLGH